MTVFLLILRILPVQRTKTVLEIIFVTHTLSGVQDVESRKRFVEIVRTVVATENVCGDVVSSEVEMA